MLKQIVKKVSTQVSPINGPESTAPMTEFASIEDSSARNIYRSAAVSFPFLFAFIWFFSDRTISTVLDFCIFIAVWLILALLFRPVPWSISVDYADRSYILSTGNPRNSSKVRGRFSNIAAIGVTDNALRSTTSILLKDSYTLYAFCAYQNTQIAIASAKKIAADFHVPVLLSPKFGEGEWVGIPIE